MARARNYLPAWAVTASFSSRNLRQRYLIYEGDAKEMRQEIRKSRHSQSVFALAIIALVLLFGGIAQAATFHVTTTADNGDNSNPTPGSLRKAIKDANANPGLDTIDFNIPGTGVHTISPPTPFANITDPVIIDGYTQLGTSPNTLAMGDNAVLLIELNGSLISTNSFALSINAGGSTVRGLVINHFHVASGGGEGIILYNKGNNVIAGNFIGTDASGQTKASNDYNINISGCSGNTIGGTTPAARNIISGDASFSIYMTYAGATDNVIQGNFIGTDSSGTVALANNAYGIYMGGVSPSLSNNLIGGSAPGAGNLISGNSTGIWLDGSVSGVMVQGNLIGTDVTGKVALANSDGIQITATLPNVAKIGGTTPAERNIISGNKGSGINVGSQSSGVIISGNYIGTDITGMAALPNGGDGVLLSGSNNVVGGTSAGAGNYISANSSAGVHIAVGTGNLVMGNKIGYASDNITALGNAKDGVEVEIGASKNVIGGQAGNSIAFNGHSGVYIYNGTGNSISSNSITSNKGLGIDLGTTGVTLNDQGDGDTGANNQQNYPVITSVTTSGNSTTSQGFLDSTPGTQFSLEFFSNAQPNALGYGEGETYLGSLSVTTDAKGIANFSAQLPLVPSGRFVSATATNLTTGDTSEFSFSMPLGATTPSLSINDIQVTEGNSGQKRATFTVTLSSVYSLPVTVSYATANGTATSQSDYIFKTGALTFNPGQTSQSITVNVVGDTQFEPDETFFVNLSNPTNAAIAKSQGTCTIQNDDAAPAGTIAFSTSAYSINESGGQATITVKRTNGSFGAVSIQYATAAGGTATVGSDYTLTNGTLNWADGDTSDKTFTVTITDDQTNEPDETVNLILSNPMGGAQLGSTKTAVLTIIDNDPQPSTVQLEQPSYSVSEGSHFKLINVTRTGDTSKDAFVDYATSDGTASQRTDYTLLLGTLHFAPGETAKSLTLLVNEDSYVEGDETLTLTLSNPVGATLGAQSVAQVTVMDNDSDPKAANAIVDTQNFVRQQYHDFLNREPDAAGFQGWQDILSKCAPNDTKCDRIEVSSAFYRSQEFQTRGYFIYRFYSAMGRIPHYLEFMRDMQKVSGFLDPQQQEQAKVDFITEFMTRSEFQQKYGQIADAAAYVDAISAAAGVTPANRDQIVNQLQSNQLTRGQALRAIVESAEVYQKFYNQAFVVMQYFGYLRRDPDILYQQWIQILNQTNDYRILVNGFINSVEYDLRFGQ